MQILVSYYLENIFDRNENWIHLYLISSTHESNNDATLVDNQLTGRSNHSLSFISHSFIGVCFYYHLKD